MKYFRPGRMFGIDIHISWSWLLIFGLVSWSLSLTFGQIHPEWSVNLRWGMAALAAFLFFASVLAHELAHSLVALARGVPVSNITLFMFGGVSNMQREPSSPSEELVITIVGPLTSLFVGAVCLVVGAGESAWTARSLVAPVLLSQLQPLGTTLAWLGSINLMIGFFNLIPAFPLDGGRIIRALMWAVSNDVHRSTRLAAWLGQAIAMAMILGGVVMILGINLPVLGAGIFNGVWLILIGFFLNNIARMGYRQTLIEERLATVRVGSVMQTRVPMVSSDATLGDLLSNSPAQPDRQTMFVLEGQEIVGMIAMKDVEKSLRERGATATIAEIMTPISELLYVKADDDVADAFERLQRFDLRHIPVMLNNRIVGMLHRKDVSRLLQLNSQLGS